MIKILISKLWLIFYRRQKQNHEHSPSPSPLLFTVTELKNTTRNPTRTNLLQELVIAHFSFTSLWYLWDIGERNYTHTIHPHCVKRQWGRWKCEWEGFRKEKADIFASEDESWCHRHWWEWEKKEDEEEYNFVNDQIIVEKCAMERRAGSGFVMFNHIFCQRTLQSVGERERVCATIASVSKCRERVMHIWNLERETRIISIGKG